jgi:membrane fusion protein (multidrug efflux system)
MMILGRNTFLRQHTGWVLVAALMLAGCGRHPDAQPVAGRTEVGVLTARSGPLPLPLNYFAKTAGSREVEVRSRVSGILLHRSYEEGRPVRQGQVMFLIDPERFAATAQQTQAELGIEQAKLDDAHRQKDRVEQLFAQKLVSQQQRDTALSTYEIAQASTRAAQAKLKSAQLDLNYTQVRAPISGLTSREAVSEGSLISTDTDSSLLTRIVQIDPLYVEFSMPEEEAALLRRNFSASNAEDAAPRVRIETEQGDQASQFAPLTFIDNAVQSETGTVRARAVMRNSEFKLIPGQFVRVHVEGLKLAEVLTVPRRAVMSGPQGNYLWIVEAGEKAESRPVQLGRAVGEDVVITDGLKEGERFVVDGALKVSPGAELAANPVTADTAMTQARRKD